LKSLAYAVSRLSSFCGLSGTAEVNSAVSMRPRKPYQNFNIIFFNIIINTNIIVFSTKLFLKSFGFGSVNETAEEESAVQRD
jgi:hypothetical protein